MCTGDKRGDRYAIIDALSRRRGSNGHMASLRSGSEPLPGLTNPSTNIPDQKLDAAAAALEQVANVREDFQQQIEAAAPSDRDRIADDAKNALVKAITDQGLTVEEYTSISSGGTERS